ncbi:response regulator transcription factor [Flavobacterium sp. GB2R13]|uniref:response regulator transcription factor n=1 Tax=Flavobacterium algoris TaxID=3398733 RepID=UPI003A861DEE
MKPTIIIVEDSLIIAMDIRSILEQEGYNVISNVVSVEQAILLIEKTPPDLVLIDINLKREKDGVNLGHYLLKKGGIPYVYITSCSDKFTLERVKETYPQGFIVKPFKKIDILTTVSLALNNFKQNNIEATKTSDIIDLEVPYILKGIVSYIEDNINEKITISDLSLRSRWKEQHFIRVFTNYIGETPYQFILSKKIAMAKKMIIETDIPVIEIGFELGFQSHANFCNAFKKITSKTPTNFRIFYSKLRPVA